ncbi:MAG TPA: cytochrome c biogenesis CcdA family protein [Thermoanaerobaculaceae bacterium]|nr:cytochrome c biogenesis CcdA family protein [Thermoanaerobaculaceae bacterium]HRS16422.1 cytochrome c biogenesis CcdA family protein [Thermoanaerobaculaceae bacterium]
MQELLQSLADQAAAASPLLTLLLVFLGGVVSSASPCVLAAVPLVVATVGGTSTNRSRAVALSTAFVLGLALCFTALGAIAALTGRLIGDVGEIWTVLLGVILVAMGLHLSGFVHLPLPQISGARFRGAGLAGAFALGALTGTLSSPCATPILVVVLSLVAFEQKVAWGTALLAVYSLGHVVLLFVAGAVSGFAGAWLGGRWTRVAQRVHQVFGIILLGVGGYLLARLAWSAVWS